MKARIVPNGNRDSEKDHIRKDSFTAQFAVIRLLLCIANFLGFRLGNADVKGAYLQSGPITRDIYVCPPRKWSGNRRVIWKLPKLPYAIVEASRQWQKTFEDWILNKAGLERICGISQLYHKRDSSGRTSLLVANLSGTLPSIQSFNTLLQATFRISNIIVDKPISFNG